MAGSTFAVFTATPERAIGSARAGRAWVMMVDTAVQERFDALAARWDDETGFHSNMSVACDHPAFREILGLGQDAVPLIVERLRDGPDLLFVALHVITGQDPLEDVPHGDVERACEAWVAWYDARGPARKP